MILTLNVSCTEEEKTVNITSNHLEVQQQGYDFNDAENEGDELSKRVEYFGWPVGKSVLFFPRHIQLILTVLTSRQPHCRSRIDWKNQNRAGAETKVLCEKGAATARVRMGHILTVFAGHRKRTREMVTMLCRRLRIRSLQ